MRKIGAYLSGCLLLLLCMIQAGYAQDFETDSLRNPEQLEQQVERDTFPVFYYLPDTYYEETPFRDSLLGHHFHQFDPVRRQTPEYKNLGAIGTAHQPFRFTPPDREGVVTGLLDAYHLYTTLSAELPFYRLQRPFTNLAYFQGADQSNATFYGQFASSFRDGLGLSIDYRRINQRGARVQFPNQRRENNALAFGLSFRRDTLRYQAYLTAAFNRINQEDNGGISEPPTTEGDLATPGSAQVFLADSSSTLYRVNELRYLHLYKLRPPQRTEVQQYEVQHALTWGDHNYKYADANPEPGFFPNLQVDPRGLRRFMEHRFLKNTFELMTYRPEPPKHDRPAGAPSVLRLGLTHTFHWVDLESRDTVLQNLFLHGHWRQPLVGRLMLEVKGRLGILDNAGDYRVSGKLRLDLGAVGVLQGELISQLYQPTLVEDQLYLTQQSLWDNNFGKTLSTTIHGAYDLPAWKLRVEGSYHLLNDYVYYDSLSVPQQSGTPISVFQLFVIKNFRLGAFHLHNHLLFQASSAEELLRVPQLFGRHSLFYQGYWFGALNVQLGADLRYNTDYFADYYNPLTGQFHLQDEQEVAFYPSIDGYISLRVRQFRAFFRWENMTRLIITDELFYQVPFYPQSTGSGLRFGISWKFAN